MALTSSVPIKLSEIKTEFGGSGTLRTYLRAAGYVASHTANASIPTSGNVLMTNFLGAEKNFTCSMTTNTNGTDVYGYSAGVTGSVSRSGIGISKSATTQVSFNGLYDAYTLDPKLGVYVYSATIFLVSGNSTGTWWDYVTWNGLGNLSRAASGVPNGTYNGSGQTYWYWAGSPYISSFTTGTFTCVLS